MTALASSPPLPLLSLRRPARARPAGAPVRLDSTTVVRHLDAMHRFALALAGSQHDAQDVVQDACVRVLARPRHLTPGSERGYLFVAVRNAWFDRLRSRSARPPEAALDDHAHLLESGRPQLDEQLDARRVYEHIAALPEAYRLVVAAVDVAGLSYADAAELLDVPAGTIMSRLHRGRSRVAAAMRA